MGEVRMVVGLGNPGKRYEKSRHNAGFKVIDSLAEALDLDLRKGKFGAAFGECEFKDKKLILLKPRRYMNRSGQVVATAVGFYRLELCDLLVISDDMALDPGRIRLRARGSAGGHNGLADIIEKLGTQEFSRLRLGIGTCGAIDDVDFVLGEPTETEKPLLNEAIERARAAVIYWLENGIEAAMNAFNAP